MPEITEDTMPGELANIIAGRIAAIYDFKGPNFVADAACASAMAAITAAIGGLQEDHYDAVVTGGIDANMSPSTFVKFCKIGALSATGTRPYAEGADGFVMGEGAVTFLLKTPERCRARRRQDLRGHPRRRRFERRQGARALPLPNPVGQRICVRRAWENAGHRAGRRHAHRRSRNIHRGRRRRRSPEPERGIDGVRPSRRTPSPSVP